MKKVRVRQYNKHGRLIDEYNSMTEAAEAVNGQEWHISECVRCRPHRKTHKGYRWEEADEQCITMGKAED